MTSVEALGRPDVICLPGTKSTCADLEWLRQQALDRAIQAHAQGGGSVVGICGGYQMLGEVIYDPHQVELAQDRTQGLGLLQVRTHFSEEKATHPVQAVVRLPHDMPAGDWLTGIDGLELPGYEIHMGRTSGDNPWLELNRQTGSSGFSVDPGRERHLDGAMSPDGRIWGCYVHGIFASTAFRRAWLRSLGWQEVAGASGDSEKERFSLALARLTDSVEAALDMGELERIIWGS